MPAPMRLQATHDGVLRVTRGFLARQQQLPDRHRMHGLWLDAATSEGGEAAGVEQPHFGGGTVHDRVVKVLVGGRARVHDVATRAGGGGGERPPGHFYALFITYLHLRFTAHSKMLISPRSASF